jgi:hypothetical protein
MNDAAVRPDVAERLQKLGMKLFCLWTDKLCGRVLTASDQRRDRVASTLFAIMTAEEFVRVGRLVIAKVLSGPSLGKAFTTLKRMAIGLSGALHAGLHEIGPDQFKLLVPKLRDMLEVLNDIAETHPWYSVGQKKMSLFGNESFRVYVTDLLAATDRVSKKLGGETDEQARVMLRLAESVRRLLKRKPPTHDSMTPWEEVHI